MTDHPLIVFDGICNLCNGAVHFVIRQDKKALFRFASLQSEAGQKIREQYRMLQGAPESFVLVQGGKLYQKSTAALKVLNRLPWYWKAFQVFWIVPKPLRDALYTVIAANRYKWFGKKEACSVPTPELKSRFLDQI